MKNKDLIQIAEKALKPVIKDDRTHGDVSAVVLGQNGKLYTGVCVDTSSWGLCAERSALAAMITDGEYKFDKVVAVWRDKKTKNLHIVPPCGICREFMRQIDQSNLEAEVILAENETKKLRELLPYSDWP